MLILRYEIAGPSARKMHELFRGFVRSFQRENKKISLSKMQRIHEKLFDQLKKF